MMLLAVLSLSFVACENEPTPPAPKADFVVEVTDVTRASVTFNVTPEDPEMYYLCAVYDVATVDNFTMDQYLISTVYQEITEAAAAQGQTVAEYMPTLLDKGAVTDVKFTGLAMDTDYYVVVWGVDATTTTFRAVTEVTKMKFRTETVEMLDDCSFDVTATVDGRDVSINVVPSNKETHWHLFIVEKAMYDQYCIDPEGPKMTDSYFFQEYFNSEIQQLMGAGYTTDQIIQMIIPTGDQTLGATGLVANTTYTYLVAGIGMDAEGAWVNSLVYKGNFTSGDVEAVDLTFNITVEDVTDTRAAIKVVPSILDAPYCWQVIEYDGVSSAEAVMDQIVALHGTWLNQGMMLSVGVQDYTGNSGSPFKYKLDAPDTDYCVIAFGYDGGVTCDPAMVTFRTLPAPDDVTFSMTASNITPYTASINITTSSEAVYYSAGVMLEEEYNEEQLIADSNANFDSWFAMMEVYNPGITIAQALATSYWRGNQQVTASSLLPDTELMGYIATFDAHTGHIAKMYTFPAILKTIPLGNSTPGIEVYGYFSGDEENGRVFDEPDVTAGKAILVTEYTGLENARSLFTYTTQQDISIPSPEFTDSYIYANTSWANITDFKNPYGYFVIPWVTDCTVLAYTNDKSGVPGAIARKLVRATAENKRPIQDLIDLTAPLDDSEESALMLPESVVVAETSQLPAPAPVVVSEVEAPVMDSPAVAATETLVGDGFVVVNELSTLRLRR